MDPPIKSVGADLRDVFDFQASVIVYHRAGRRRLSCSPRCDEARGCPGDRDTKKYRFVAGITPRERNRAKPIIYTKSDGQPNSSRRQDVLSLAIFRIAAMVSTSVTTGVHASGSCRSFRHSPRALHRSVWTPGLRQKQGRVTSSLPPRNLLPDLAPIRPTRQRPTRLLAVGWNAGSVS